jgi:hypothetical protein
MKNLLTVAVLMLVLAATAANLNLRKVKHVTVVTSDATDSVVIQQDSLFYDSVGYSLKSIPKAQDLYTVAKKTVGRWSKLFVAIKIEESGADGKNSFYALKYNNLTGMRYPGAGRTTTSTGMGHNYYAIFNNWHDCMVDFKMYMDVMEGKFKARFNREPKDEYEMVNFMHGSFNVYQKWHDDVFWLLYHFNYK